MSTYTDLHTRKRENLTILRMPGDPHDGITPQRVIFVNPENIYEGTFKGTLSGATLVSVDFKDSIFDGGLLKNASISVDEDTIVPLDGLALSAISTLVSCENIIALIDGDFTSKIEELSTQISGAVISIVELSNEVNCVSSELTGSIIALDSKLSTLSDETYAMSSSLKQSIESTGTALSNAISGLSAETSNISSSLDRDINYLSTELSTTVKEVILPFDASPEDLDIDNIAMSLSTAWNPGDIIIVKQHVYGESDTSID